MSRKESAMLDLHTAHAAYRRSTAEQAATTARLRRDLGHHAAEATTTLRVTRSRRSPVASGCTPAAA
jgi:hypothetical protein